MAEVHNIELPGDMYSIVLGRHPAANLLLLMLANLAEKAEVPFEVGRHRDTWVERHGDGLAVRLYTRMGGGNRKDYVRSIATLRLHPWYWRDEDDTYDTTYASFYFMAKRDAKGLPEMPDDVWQLTVDALMHVAQEPVDVQKRWEQAMADRVGPP